MENQELNRYVGDYDHFQEVYAVKKSQLEAAYRRQQQEISELKDFVARNKARVSTRNMAMSRQKKLDKMDIIELAAEKPKPEFRFKVGRTPGKYIFETKDLVIGYDEPLSKPLSLSMERGHKIALVGANGIGKTTLLKSILGLIHPLKGSVELGENLMIGYFEQESAPDNKTTCIEEIWSEFPLKSILGLIHPLKGSVELGENLMIGYFEQESAPDNKTTCIEEIWSEFPSFTQYEVRSALAKCGLTTKHIESQVRVLSGGEQAKVRLCKLINRETNILLLDEPTNGLTTKHIESQVRVLSGGEQAKVRLCKLINRETNILLLDEPTNHLDVDAKAELKRALQEYNGSILLICHEPDFYQDVVNEVWDCTKWTTKII